jgi:hypothetical protein
VAIAQDRLTISLEANLASPTMGTKQITVVIHAKPVRQLPFELWGDVPDRSKGAER